MYVNGRAGIDHGDVEREVRPVLSTCVIFACTRCRNSESRGVCRSTEFQIGGVQSSKGGRMTVWPGSAARLTILSRLCAVRGATTHLRFRTSTPTDESMSEHGILLSLTIVCKKEKKVMNATENLIRGSEKSILDRAYHRGTNERA